MRYEDDNDGKGRRHRRGPSNLALVGMAAILGIASLSAYLLSGDTPVKPASGTAQAMALAGSK